MTPVEHDVQVCLLTTVPAARLRLGDEQTTYDGVQWTVIQLTPRRTGSRPRPHESESQKAWTK